MFLSVDKLITDHLPTLVFFFLNYLSRVSQRPRIIKALLHVIKLNLLALCTTGHAIKVEPITSAVISIITVPPYESAAASPSHSATDPAEFNVIGRSKSNLRTKLTQTSLFCCKCLTQEHDTMSWTARSRVEPTNQDKYHKSIKASSISLVSFETLFRD